VKETVSLEKYPVFNHKVYKSPQGGIILPKSWLKERYSRYKRMDTPLEPDASMNVVWGTLNTFGTRILLECSGEKTIGEIASQLYQEKAEKFKESILTFFNNMSLRFDIDFFDEPSPCEVESCGTFECYYPLRVLAEVTTRCNLTCQHCLVSAGADGVDMKKEDLFTLIDTVSDEGTIDFEISGGEPFCRRDIFDIVEKCCSTFRGVVFATNGTLIGKEEAHTLSTYENLFVQVSLDSHTPEFHDTFRGVTGAFEKAVSGISTLVSEGVKTHVEVTVTKENIKAFEKILLLAEELGVRGVNYDMAKHVGRGENLTQTPDEVMSWMKEVDTVCEKYKDRPSPFFERLRREFTQQNCGAGRTFWTVGPTGNVRPCNYLHEGYLVCGNLLKEAYDTIFNRDSAVRFSSIEFPGKALCGECRYLLYCDSCFCNGVVMYERLKDKCTWGSATEIGEWITM
jgi:MoaA/NifB/PqqE/SkfB family radical SAM enzyme